MNIEGASLSGDFECQVFALSMYELRFYSCRNIICDQFELTDGHFGARIRITE